MQNGNYPEALKQQIIALGIEFRLMTQFTSFVAVEEMTVTVGGEPTTLQVPVEMPEGVSYEGVFGADVMGAREMSLGVPFVSQSRVVSGRGARGRAAPPPPKAAARREVQRARIALGPNEGEEHAAKELSAERKLAEPLRDLAAKVEKQGQDGNLTVGELKVVDYKVDVMISLRDLSDETLKALKELGFVQTGESKAVRLLIGTIDVRKLEDLAKLDVVIRVKPVKG